MPKLSEKQMQVLKLRLSGLNIKQIAEELGISDKAVDKRLKIVRKKLKVTPSKYRRPHLATRHLAAAAIKAGLVAEEQISPYVMIGLPNHYKEKLEVLSRGLSTEEIAKTLYMEPISVLDFLGDLYAHFSVDGTKENSRLNLVARAKYRGLLDTPEVVIENSIRFANLVGEAYRCLFFRLSGYSYQQISEMFNVEQSILWWRMGHLARKFGLETKGFWEEGVVSKARKYGELPPEKELPIPSLVTGYSLSGLEIALLHHIYTRAPISWDLGFEDLAKRWEVRPETIHGILRRACKRAGVNPDRPYAYLSTAEWMYRKPGRNMDFCEKVAVNYGLA